MQGGGDEIGISGADSAPGGNLTAGDLHTGDILVFFWLSPRVLVPCARKIFSPFSDRARQAGHWRDQGQAAGQGVEYRIQGSFMTETFKQVWDALERDQAERERKFRTESEKRAF